MSEARTELETIYVELLNEGTKCWRPVLANPLGKGRYRIMSKPEEDERWAFTTDDVVACKNHVFQDGNSGLIAFEKCT